jgi:hypothetical protein
MRLAALVLLACAEPPTPQVWTTPQEVEDAFDGLELRLVRGRQAVESWRSLRWFTEQRRARRERRARALALARRDP